MKSLSPFELQLQGIASGTIIPPSVSVNGKDADYIGYTLSTHHYASKILASGLKMRNIKINDLKKYYGIKGTAQSIAEQIGKIKDTYLASLTEK
jgi:hypothetical protein